jgi:uncharacterized protein (DUF885 family)
MKYLVLACSVYLSMVSLSYGQFAVNVEAWKTDKTALERFYSIDFSNTRFERLQQFYLEWEQRLDEVSFHHLDRDEKMDYLLLKNDIAHSQRMLHHDKAQFEETVPFLPFASDIISLEEDRWQLKKIEPQQAAKQIADLISSIKQIRKKIKADEEQASEEVKDDDKLTLSPVLAYRTSRYVESLHRTLQHWYDHFNEFHPEFGWWCQAPFADASNAMKDYAKFLKEDIAGLKGKADDPLVGDPIGAERLLDDLRYEMISYSPEALLAIGEKEFAWCQQEMKRVATEMGFDGNWQSALEHVKARHVPPGEQDQLVARYALDAIAFMDTHDLVSIPPLCRETWRVEMLSEQAQKTLPFAAYGGQHMLVAYPTIGMDDQRKRESMKGNNLHFTRIVTAHELIPGHHLQGFVSQREKTHRSVFRTPFLVEGWALHWEMLLWDQNYARGPEDRMGMLFWRKHRCARIIVSLKFHLNQMTPDEMIHFLVEEVGLERDGATSEVRRYIGDSYSPLYQCAYMIGGLQLRALHRELVGTQKMTNREFHDAVLRQNAIPVALIRAALTKSKIAEEGIGDWLFYD